MDGSAAEGKKQLPGEEDSQLLGWTEREREKERERF